MVSAPREGVLKHPSRGRQGYFTTLLAGLQPVGSTSIVRRPPSVSNGGGSRQAANEAAYVFVRNCVVSATGVRASRFPAYARSHGHHGQGGGRAERMLTWRERA